MGQSLATGDSGAGAPARVERCQHRPGMKMRAIDKVEVELSVVVGRTQLPIQQLLRLGRGAVIILDSRETDGVEVLVNNTPYAQGQVVVRDDKICVEITDTRPRER
jgi:flagellar motor switch protein FliN/FliY